MGNCQNKRANKRRRQRARREAKRIAHAIVDTIPISSSDKESTCSPTGTDFSEQDFEASNTFETVGVLHKPDCDEQNRHIPDIDHDWMNIVHHYYIVLSDSDDEDGKQALTEDLAD